MPCSGLSKPDAHARYDHMAFIEHFTLKVLCIAKFTYARDEKMKLPKPAACHTLILERYQYFQSKIVYNAVNFKCKLYTNPLIEKIDSWVRMDDALRGEI